MLDFNELMKYDKAPTQKREGDAMANALERIYLSDVIETEKFKKGQANIIVAPCHSGKTTAAIGKIARLASCREKVLFLIDTTAGKDALLQKPGTAKISYQWLRDIEEEWWGAPQSGEGIRIMTYHQLGYQLIARPDFMKDIEVVICDEMHNLIKYKGIEYSQNKERGTLGTNREQTICKRALAELARISNQTENVPLVVIMTATVNTVSRELDKLSVNTETFDYSALITTDRTEDTRYYADIETALKELPTGEKAVVYIASISDMRKWAAAADNGQRKICCLWGINNPDNPMSKEQLAVRSAILKTQRIPDDVDLLFINAAYETSINIENEDFNTMVIHNSSPDIQIQVRGRLRHDIKTLYIYDRNHEKILDYFPAEYFDKFLTSDITSQIADRMNLRDEKGHQRRWPSIRDALEKDGAVVTLIKQKGQRGCIVRRPA